MTNEIIIKSRRMLDWGGECRIRYNKDAPALF